MATNERVMDVPLETLWEVLDDGFSYAGWVVGTRTIRAVDEGFPRPGARLHYRISLGPLHFDDHTEVEEVRPQRMLLLRAKAWPMGEATIRLRTEAVGSQTRVAIDEEPTAGLGALLHNPAVDLLIKLRNLETLRRLERLARLRLSAPGTVTSPPRD